MHWCIGLHAGWLADAASMVGILPRGSVTAACRISEIGGCIRKSLVTGGGRNAWDEKFSINRADRSVIDLRCCMWITEIKSVRNTRRRVETNLFRWLLRAIKERRVVPSIAFIDCSLSEEVDRGDGEATGQGLDDVEVGLKGYMLFPPDLLAVLGGLASVGRIEELVLVAWAWEVNLLNRDGDDLLLGVQQVNPYHEIGRIEVGLRGTDGGGICDNAKTERLVFGEAWLDNDWSPFGDLEGSEETVGRVFDGDRRWNAPLTGVVGLCLGLGGVGIHIVGVDTAGQIRDVGTSTDVLSVGDDAVIFGFDVDDDAGDGGRVVPGLALPEGFDAIVVLGELLVDILGDESVVMFVECVLFVDSVLVERTDEFLELVHGLTKVTCRCGRSVLEGWRNRRRDGRLFLVGSIVGDGGRRFGTGPRRSVGGQGPLHTGSNVGMTAGMVVTGTERERSWGARHTVGVRTSWRGATGIHAGRMVVLCFVLGRVAGYRWAVGLGVGGRRLTVERHHMFTGGHALLVARGIGPLLGLAPSCHKLKRRIVVG